MTAEIKTIAIKDQLCKGLHPAICDAVRQNYTYVTKYTYVFTPMYSYIAIFMFRRQLHSS